MLHVVISTVWTWIPKLWIFPYKVCVHLVVADSELRAVRERREKQRRQGRAVQAASGS